MFIVVSHSRYYETNDKKGVLTFQAGSILGSDILLCFRGVLKDTILNKSHCYSELRMGIKCIDNFTNVCMEKHEQVVFRRIYAGITDVVQELCTRGQYQDEYLKHADCVKMVRSDYETCSKNYEVTLMTLGNQQGDQYQTDQTSHEDHLRTVCW